MINCPNCQHANMDGATFCAECGMQLSVYPSLSTKSIIEDERHDTQMFTNEQIEEELKKRAAHETPKTLTNSWLTLHFLDSGKLLPLEDRTEFTFGRVSNAQPIMPDIDLTPFQAYAYGVSRLHAVIKHEERRISIRDLGSSNGTYINGRRITPLVDQELNQGDIVSLGKLKIQIMLRNI